MRKKQLLMIFTLLFLCLSLQAEKVAVLEEITKPDYQTIGNGYIYVQEKASIYIYNLKDYKFVKKFGKEGEGPKEFKINPFGAPMITDPFDDRLLVSSMAKVSIYSKEGEFIKEFKVSPMETYAPFGKDSYICIGTAANKKGSQVLALFLTDSQFQKQKELYQSDISVGMSFQFEFPISPFDPDTYEERIYIAAGKHGLAIDVFDKTGEKLYQIKKEYQPIKLPAQYRKKTEEWFNRHPTWSQMYQMFKDRFSYKEYYPAIFSMTVDNGYIYVLTNKLKGEERECIVMDVKGKEKKRVFLPAPEIYGLEFLPEFTFHDGSFYILVDNEDEEVWELHKTKIHQPRP